MLIGLQACGGGDSDGDDTFVEPEKNPIEALNSAPSIPVLVYPDDELVCIDNALEFRWTTASDVDGDPVTYTIQVAKDASFADIVYEISTGEIKASTFLEKGSTFFWRTMATDNISDSAYSKAWKFYTEAAAVTNQLPSQPQLIAPAMDQILTATSADLSWKVADTETLTYDLYFGTQVAPPLYREALNAPAATVAITPGSVYYWQIISKDARGGASIGPIWRFSAE